MFHCWHMPQFIQLLPLSNILFIQMMFHMLFCICGEISSGKFLDITFLGQKVNAKLVLLYFTKFPSIDTKPFCILTMRVCQCLVTHCHLRALLNMLWEKKFIVYQ